MISCAWIGLTEIIPFDSIEYVEDSSSDERPLIEVHMQTSGKLCTIIGQDEIDAFTKAYGDYLKHMSKALAFIGDE